MKINFDTIIKQNSRIISHKFRKRIYLMDPKSGEVRILNESAGLIWEAFEKPKKISQAIKMLADFYGLPGKGIQKDVAKFIEKYLKLKLLKVRK